MSGILLSIVIPTHNRVRQLLRSLDALSKQTFPVSQFDVHIISDNCTDNTYQIILDYAHVLPYSLFIYKKKFGSAAAARNFGAEQSTGKFLLFLDDDILPDMNLVKEHLDILNDTNIVIGYSKPVLPANPSLWQLRARRWWEDRFYEMADPGHIFTFKDFFSGNVSMAAQTFKTAGGFNVSLKRLEDYELGLRLLKAGIKFRFSPKAFGYHFEQTSLEQWLDRIIMDGESKIKIGNLHPEMRLVLFPKGTEVFGYYRSIQFVIRKIASKNSGFFDYITKKSLMLLNLLENLRLRGLWDRLTGVITVYNFWRGVFGIAGKENNFKSWLQEATLTAPLSSDAPQIDIMKLDALCSQQASKAIREKGIRLQYDGIDLLTLGPEPGSEPIQRFHIPAIIREEMKRHFSAKLAAYFFHKKEFLTIED